MAGTFFDNFKDAGRISLSTNPYGEFNLPTPNGENSGAWTNRAAIPFKFIRKDKNGKHTEQAGILYIPSYETHKISPTGELKNDYKDIEIYGAELPGTYKNGELVEAQSLSSEGFRKLFNNPNNTNFTFGFNVVDPKVMQKMPSSSDKLPFGNPGVDAFSMTYGHNPQEHTASGYRAEGRGSTGTPFISNLRNVLRRWKEI